MNWRKGSPGPLYSLCDSKRYDSYLGIYRPPYLVKKPVAVVLFVDEFMEFLT